MNPQPETDSLDSHSDFVDFMAQEDLKIPEHGFVFQFKAKNEKLL